MFSRMTKKKAPNKENVNYYDMYHGSCNLGIVV